MDNAKNQIVDSLKSTNNILVTVSNNPSVDQLSAALGFSLLLNKQGKHATAVYSGTTPSTIEFLQPEKTFEKNTDSLRDFIIALDKAKADVIRYKVEGDHVRIFITPYRTSISEKDLQYSQGDFNIDTVIAIGVKDQKDLDRAITAHGRILHGASVIQIDNQPGGSIGNISWTDAGASSLCEMMASLANDFAPDSLDGQMATAFLTGIVAETARFSNDKTTATAMSLSAKLMAEGANQQLIATELQKSMKPDPEPAPAEQHQHHAAQAYHPPAESTMANDGSLQISHGDTELPPVEFENEESQGDPLEQIHIDEQGSLQPITGVKAEGESAITGGGNSLVLEPPTLGGTLTANSRPEDEESEHTTDPMSDVNTQQPLLTHEQPVQAPEPVLNIPAPEYEALPSEPLPQSSPPQQQSAPPAEPEPTGQTLADLEVAVDSPHSQAPSSSAGTADLNEARDAVLNAVASDVSGQPLPPVQALNSHPVDLDFGHNTTITDVVDPSQPSPAPSAAPPTVPPPLMPPLPGMGQADPYAAGMPPLPPNSPSQPPQPPQPPAPGPM